MHTATLRVAGNTGKRDDERAALLLLSCDGFAFGVWPLSFRYLFWSDGSGGWMFRARLGDEGAWSCCCLECRRICDTFCRRRSKLAAVLLVMGPASYEPAKLTQRFSLPTFRDRGDGKAIEKRRERREKEALQQQVQQVQQEQQEEQRRQQERVRRESFTCPTH